MNNLFKDSGERLRTFFFPPVCVGCREVLDVGEAERGAVFCPECAAKWKSRERITYLSGLGKGGVPPLLGVGGCFDMVTLVKYRPSRNSAPEKIIYHLKRKSGRRVVNFLAGRLALGIEKVEKLPPSQDILVTYVPRQHRAVCKTGIDQAERLAQGLSRATGYEFCRLISRRGIFAPAQKKLDTAKRRQNARDIFLLCDGAEIQCAGKTVIITDDLLTTGATLGVCAALLYSAGAARVICATVAVTA